MGECFVRTALMGSESQLLAPSLKLHLLFLVPCLWHRLFSLGTVYNVCFHCLLIHILSLFSTAKKVFPKILVAHTGFSAVIISPCYCPSHLILSVSTTIYQCPSSEHLRSSLSSTPELITLQNSGFSRASTHE